MATVDEAAETFARDLTAVPPNIAGLMLVFTPEGMLKAMVMQQQLTARATAALAAGRVPAPTTGYTVAHKGQEGEDQILHLNLESADGTAEVMPHCREIEAAWKVRDLASVAVRAAGGRPGLAAAARRKREPPRKPRCADRPALHRGETASESPSSGFPSAAVRSPVRPTGSRSAPQMPRRFPPWPFPPSPTMSPIARRHQQPC